ncbi:MAG: hypothetical protein ACKPKO_10745, partial [Candidatus Fonsibacter sp.]
DGDKSHHIYTNMSAIIITWNTCADDTFKVFRDEICDMFGVDPLDFYIAHQIKFVRDEFRARDLPHGAWVSINFRSFGGGKRPSVGSGGCQRGRTKTVTENPFKEVHTIKVTEKDQSLFEIAFINSVKYCSANYIDSLQELKET